jgi:pilus assembly protein CpaF
MANIITLFSTKGGVGKTFIAANLAVALAKNYEKKVLLIELDTQGVGDTARVLSLNPQKAMVDFILGLKRNPQDVKKENYVTRGSSAIGIDFLPALLKPQQAPHLETAHFKAVFGLLDKDYDYIVIDAGKNFNETFISSLNHANLILLVVTPDILSIYQTKWALDTLQFLHFPLSMIKIVLNRAESMSSISWQEVRVTLPVDIICRIPSEGRIVGQSVNQGVPTVIDNPRSKVAVAIKNFASDLTTDKSMFIEHQEVDHLRLKELGLEKAGAFWRDAGLTEPLAEPLSDETDEIIQLKRRIHNRLIEELNLKRLDSKVFSDVKKTKELRNRAEMMVANFLAEEAGSFISSSEVRRKLVKEILDEALALGPLEDLLADPSVTDIMVNNKDEVYVERNGKIKSTSKKFISNEQVKVIIERIIAPIGRRIDESVPMVDARLPDGSRVNAIIPPLALTGPSLTIRKFRKEKFTIEELIDFKSIGKGMAEFTKASVLSRKNVIVSGGTGSGKTTFLNVLSSFIPDEERIITIEDAAELKLNQRHWIRLESRPPNIEGKGAMTIRELFRNTLRMRPDRIIIGECRGVETMDMLQAMNTGHDGSMTTIHANATQDVLVRLDSMLLMSGIELPIRAIREMIASAIDLIIHTARLSDGSRKVMQITEVAGMKDDMHIDLRDVFSFRQTGVGSNGHVEGEFHATGYIPSFAEEIKVKGIPLSDDIFKTS